MDFQNIIDCGELVYASKAQNISSFRWEVEDKQLRTWSTKEFQSEISYYKSYPLEDIDLIICGALHNLPEYCTTTIELATILGFNVYDDFNSEVKHYEDSAEIVIFESLFKKVLEWGLISVEIDTKNEENNKNKKIDSIVKNNPKVSLTKLGLNSLVCHCKYEFFSSSKIIYENEYKPLPQNNGELFPFYKTLGIYSNIGYSTKIPYNQIVDLETLFNPKDIEEIQIHKLQSNEELNIYSSIKKSRCLPKTFDVNIKLYYKDNNYYPIAFNAEQISIEASELLNSSENIKVKERKIEWGLYLKLLNDPNAILNYISLEPFFHLLVLSNIIEDKRLEWEDDKLFKYIGLQANANQWSKISNICPTNVLKRHLIEFKNNFDWGVLTNRFENDYILQNPILFPWNFDILLHSENIGIEDVKMLLTNQYLRDISEFNVVEETENSTLNETNKIRYIEWDWDVIMPLLDDDFIFSHINDIKFDLSNLTKRLEANNYKYIANYPDRYWDWNFISSEYDLSFILQNITIISSYLNLKSVCNRAFTSIDFVSEFCLSPTFKQVLEIKENPSLIGFNANQSNYLWSDLLIETLNQVGLLGWVSTERTYGFECNPYLNWDKDFFEKYHSNIKTEYGFRYVSEQIDDINILNVYPNFLWDWSILSSKEVFHSNITFLLNYKENINLNVILENVSWSVIESVFDQLNILQFLESNTNLWNRITTIAAKEFILQNLEFLWDWSVLTQRFCNTINIGSLGNTKWIDKWDWEYLSKHLECSLIKDNLNIYEKYWKWDIITERLSSEVISHNLLQYKEFWNWAVISERLSSEFIAQNLEQYKNYWKWDIITGRLSSEHICYNLFQYKDYWDWVFLSNKLNIEDIQENLKTCTQFWAWNTVSERLQPEFIIQNLLLYKDYWDWDIVVNEKFEEEFLCEENVLQSIVQCFSTLDEELRVNYWGVITSQLGINQLEELIKNTHNTPGYLWDYKYLYNHKYFDEKKYLLNSSQYINWNDFSESNAANRLFVFDSNIYSKSTWVNKIIAKLLNNSAFNWDYNGLSKLSMINANHEIFKINNDKWDWDYISEFSLCFNSSKFKVNFNLHIENINFSLFSVRTDTGLDEYLIEQYIDKNWDWNTLVINPSIDFSFKFIDKHIDKPWDWNFLSKRSDFILTEDLIIKYADKPWDWQFLSRNKSFIPNDSVLSTIKDKWVELDWVEISKNIEEDLLSVEFLVKYKDCLYWPVINKKIKDNITEEYLSSLYNVLDWSIVSKSMYISFTEELIEKYRSKWDWQSLCKNPQLTNRLNALVKNYKAEFNCVEFLEKFDEIGKTPYIYHFTHLFNAIDIIKNRKILSRNKAKELGLLKYDAAGNVVERSKKAHPFARFYFRPQTLTQYYNEALGADSLLGENGWEFGGYNSNGDKIWRTKWKSKYPKALNLGLPKCPIPVFFKFDLKEVLTSMLDKCNYSTGNMQSDWALVERVANNPNAINTDYLYSTINDGIEIYKKYSQQEFLVDDDFDFSELNSFEIICYNDDYANLLKAQLGENPICQKINSNGWDIFHRSNRELQFHESENVISIISEYQDGAYLSIRGEGIKNIKIINPETIQKETESEIIAYPEIKFLKPERPIEVHFVDTTIGKRDWLVYSSSLVSALPNQLSNAEYKISEDIISCFEQLESQLKLSLSKELFYSHMVDSYHGIAHTARVLFGACLLVNYVDNITEDIKEAIYYAAIIHDLGKTSDREGSTHGESSEFLYRDKINEYISDTNIMAMTLEAVKYHSVDDWSCPIEVKDNIIWKVLKDADALDRGRFNRRCDRSYLRLDIFKTELGSQIVDFMDKLPNLTRKLQWNNPLNELADCLKTSNL